MKQRTVQAIRHIGFEDLGSFEAPLRDAGYQIDYIDVAERDPGALDPLIPDLLVILGGPIGVYEEEAYPVVSTEVQLLRTRLQADLPTLGICLGGWSALELAGTRESNPLAPLRDVPVLHWHGDTFDLPDGCSLLASTPICRNQAFSRGPNVLGLQFHPEVLEAGFEHWLLGHASELATAGISPVTLRRDTRLHAGGLGTAGVALLTEWLKGLQG